MRAIAVLSLILLLAGCTDPQSPAGAFERSDDIVVARNTGHYVGFELSSGTAVLEVTYTSSPDAIDVFVVSSSNLDAVKAGQSFIAKCSDEAARNGSLTCTLGPGEYHIVFDNTDYGAAKPTGDARVSYSYRVT